MRRISLTLLLASFALPTVVFADEAALLERIEQLELRLQDLEANPPAPVDSGGAAATWTRHVRLGGHAATGYYAGGRHSDFDPDAFRVLDTRLFVDVQLGDSISVADQLLVRNAGFTFEWNLVRRGRLFNDVGDLYADLQGIFGREELNVQLGRFQIPVGEAYLRRGTGSATNPFISHPVGGPWWWDEGVRLYGNIGEGLFGYVASTGNGDSDFNSAGSESAHYTLKLFTNPLPWLHLSVSGLHSGKIGDEETPAEGALWLGESWARAFGSDAPVPNFQGGVAVPDGPNELDRTWLLAADAILDFDERLRVWLAYGHYDIDSEGGSFYDRALQYWIAEAIVYGAWISQTLRPFYVGVRGSGLGTYDTDEGYLLDVRHTWTLGYNMESLTAISAVFGWDLTRGLRLRAEYTHVDIDLVRGVTPQMRDAARDTDYFGVELRAAF